MSRIIPHDHSNVHQGGKIRATTSIVGVDHTSTGGSDHPDLAAHDDLGLATDAELAAQLAVHDSTVILQLTNKSGGSVAAGDLVIIDTANDTAFTTTTSGQVEVSVGIAQATIASNAVGSVLVSGYAALVNVPSSMTRGRYLETHTVAKQATGSATRRAGSFGQFLIGGSTPSAWLWGQTDQTATGGSGSVATDTIWDAKGDLAVGTGADTAAKLTVGSNDTILMADSGQATGLKYVGSQTPSTQAFSDAAAEGTADTYARGDHKHGMPANPGGGGALVLLEQHTASSSATLDFTTFISSTYDDYLIELVNVIPANNNINFVIRVGTGGGPTYDSGANYGWFERSMRVGGGDVSSGAVSGATSMQIAGVSVGVSNNTLWGVSGNVHLTSPQSTSLNKTFYGQTRWFYDAGADPVMSTCHGTYISTTALTALRFLFGTGNIASGTIRIYGVAK